MTESLAINLCKELRRIGIKPGDLVDIEYHKDKIVIKKNRDGIIKKTRVVAGEIYPILVLRLDRNASKIYVRKNEIVIR